MTGPLPITISTVGHCQECGAIVHDEVRHFEWHAAQQPTDPAPAPDPWEEALARRNLPSLSRDGHVGAALSWLAVTFERSQPGDLVGAAAHIRAMAPEGTVWRLPRSDHDVHVRERLRSVVRMLVDADQYDSDELRRDRLALAEANLHGLWLAAQEVG